MKLHDKSCMLDSFCHVLGIAHWRAIVWLGHDGSEYGFHSQELIDVAFIEGYSVTEIQRRPVGIHPQTGNLLQIKSDGVGDRRFAGYLANGNGVVMGSRLGVPHAVSWIDRAATDPATGLNFRLLTDSDQLVEEFFVPHTFLRVTRNG